MKKRMRQLGVVVFDMAAAVSLGICFGAMALTLFGNHFHRKFIAVGPFEAMSHHDVIIATWGTMHPNTRLQATWSAEFPGGGFDADIDTRHRTERIFSLNVTHFAVIVGAALLPGVWVAWYLRRRAQGEIDYCPACGKTIGTEEFAVCPACGIRFAAPA